MYQCGVLAVHADRLTVSYGDVELPSSRGLMLNLTDLASIFTIAGVFVAVGMYWLSRRPAIEARATRSIWPLEGRPDIQIKFLNRGSRPVTVRHVGFSILGASILHEVAAPQAELSDGQSCIVSVSSSKFASQLFEMLKRDKTFLPKKEAAWQIEGVFIISIDDDKHYKIKLDTQVSRVLAVAVRACLSKEANS